MVSVVGNSIPTNTTAFPGYIAEITDVKEYISQISYDTDSYTIFNNNEGASFSDSADYSITFDSDDLTGSLVEVRYLYWTQGQLVNDLFNTSVNRYPSSDIKVKSLSHSTVQLAPRIIIPVLSTV